MESLFELLTELTEANTPLADRAVRAITDMDNERQHLRKRLAEALAKLDADPDDPIPDNVFWFEVHGTFYGGHGQPMGQEFHDKWYPRRLEFPKYQSELK